MKKMPTLFVRDFKLGFVWDRAGNQSQFRA